MSAIKFGVYVQPPSTVVAVGNNPAPLAQPRVAGLYKILSFYHYKPYTEKVGPPP